MAVVARTYRPVNEIFAKRIGQGDNFALQGFEIALYHDATDGLLSSQTVDPANDITTEPSGYTRPTASPSQYVIEMVNGEWAITIETVTIDVTGVDGNSSLIDAAIAITQRSDLNAGSAPNAIAASSLVEDRNASEIDLAVVDEITVDGMSITLESGVVDDGT